MPNIARMPVPATLAVPLWQYHPGSPLGLAVAEGEGVAEGDTLARPLDPFGVPVLSPAAGAVREIRQAKVAGAARPDTKAVVLDTRATGRGPSQTMAGPGRSTSATVREGGLRGLGGAAYPVHLKLEGFRGGTLVVNLMETDPDILCDRSALKEMGNRSAAGLVAEAAALLGAGSATVAVPQDAFFATGLAREASRAGIGVALLPPHYALGHSRLLVERLGGGVGQHTEAGESPLVLNFGTVRALHSALARGTPLSSRLVTIRLPGADRRLVLDCPFGASVRDLLEAAGQDAGNCRVRAGGFAGDARTGVDDIVGPTTNSVVVREAEAPRREPMPCIGCNRCDDRCPAGISPRRLWALASAGKTGRAAREGLLRCVGCRSCDLACPSGIRIAGDLARAIGEHRAAEELAARRKSARELHRPADAGATGAGGEEEYCPNDMAGDLVAQAMGRAGRAPTAGAGGASGGT